MALLNINDLPENILLEVFVHLPACQLLLCCRPVCSLWRDLIDVVTMWKHKCLREGFIAKEGDPTVADWKIFYFLHSLHQNLLQNPCAEGCASSRSWWTSKPKATGVSCWTNTDQTSDILVKDWFAPRSGCGCTYLLSVYLTTEDLITLASFEPPPVTFPQWNDARWREVSHTFSDYPPGVRYVLFQHEGRDTQNWAGWYGPCVINSSVTVSPTRRIPNPAPEGTA